MNDPLLTPAMRSVLERIQRAAGNYPVVAIEAVPVAGFFGRMIDTVRMWFS